MAPKNWVHVLPHAWGLTCDCRTGLILTYSVELMSLEEQFVCEVAYHAAHNEGERKSTHELNHFHRFLLHLESRQVLDSQFVLACTLVVAGITAGSLNGLLDSKRQLRQTLP